MRFIDTNGFSPTHDWLKRAAALTEALKKATSAEARKKILDDNASLWTEQKPSLSSLSHDKCWYCESRQVRSDNAVDHFRPKGRVKDLPGHQGYWWLAFDWKNYRYTCTFCNSLRKSASTAGGKHDFFPLKDETRRANSHTDDLEDEMPVLLDPTCIADVVLIAFSEDGSVGPAVDKTTDMFEWERARNSIERYHLTQPSIVEQRIKRLKEVDTWLKSADHDLDRFTRTGEPYARLAAESRMRDIRNRVLGHEEYSTAVKHLLIGRAASVAAQKILRII